MEFNFNQLSPEQQQAVRDQVLAEEKQKAEKQKAERKAYKDLVNQTIPDLYTLILEASAKLSEVKTLVFNETRTLIELKAQCYDKEPNLQTHSFTTEDGVTITLGHRFNDGWDDTVTAGLEKVRTYLESLITDDKTKMLIATIQKLLSRDAKGNLKASRVLQLKKLADDTGDEKFIDAVKIIQDAYRPTKSVAFVSCSHIINDKREDIALDISAAPFDFKIEEETTETN